MPIELAYVLGLLPLALLSGSLAVFARASTRPSPVERRSETR